MTKLADTKKNSLKLVSTRIPKLAKTYWNLIAPPYTNLVSTLH